MIIGICDFNNEIKNKILSLLRAFVANKDIQVKILEIQSAKELVSSNEKIDLVFMSDKGVSEGMNASIICDVLHKQKEECLVALIVEDKESSFMVLSKNVCAIISNDFEKEQFYDCLNGIYSKIILKDDLLELVKDTWERKSKIRYIKASDKYCEIYVNDSYYVVRSGISAIESKLCGEGFIRVHRSYIVNLAYVEGIDNVIRLNDGRTVKYSRNKKEELLIKYSEYKP